MNFGQRKSKSAADRWRVLCVLADEVTPVDVTTVIERGWPVVARLNPTGYCNESHPLWWARHEWCRLSFYAANAALRWLKARGLAESYQPHGYRKNFWTITPEGIAAHDCEHAEFEASVLGDLDALPEVSPESRPA